MEISEKTLNFIQEHGNEDTTALRLKYGGNFRKTELPIEFALLQIEARRKARTKIPSFLENLLFIFPDSISAEQASNESVARFHASLLRNGSSLLDITAGLGIDDLTFAMHGVSVTACEIDNQKSEALLHNAGVLGLSDRIGILNVDSMDYIKNCDKHFDAVFADPARRSKTGRRLHALADCQPDMLSAMESIMRISDRLLIKCSPMLDLKLIRNTVDNLSHIHVVCFKGECKEVLIDIEKNRQFSGVTVTDLDMNQTISTFNCNLSPTSESISIQFADRKDPSDYRYLYEPNAGVMKTGAWSTLTDIFPELRKADPNTHLFLSDMLTEGFPGRVLAISCRPDKKAIKNMKGTKCNVVARNFPSDPLAIAKKHSLISGGERFLYAFRYKGEPSYILAEPVKGRIVQE